MMNSICSRRKRSNVWPTREQELLLRAALLQGRDALEAWDAWKSHADIDRLEPGAYRLLPLLYQNLKRHAVHHPHMNIFRGVYRKTWYENQMLFHTIASLLRSFHGAGIAVMVLKGAALTLLCYKDYGIRPMNDIDILVRPEHAVRAVHLLKELGWLPIDFMPTEEYMSVSYSHGFRNNAGQECDLHWHVLSQCRKAHDDDVFWQDADEVKIHDATAYVLNPTDQLLHVCIHGARWNITPPIRWIADAITILNNHSAVIDWDRLILQADRLRLILPLRDTLNYLKTQFNAPIDGEFLHSINTLAVPQIERIE
ncbi:MAG: nucleotidyltransferase family protein, partial [Thermodesulfovibrionales bacterium]|nr:nucleotidyltransferase family protein [Thermodesulfovibrionales bacterium]